MIRSSLVSYLYLFGVLSNLVLPEILILGKPVYISYFVSVYILFLWLVILLKYNAAIKVYKYTIYIFLILLSMFISYAYALLFLQANVSSSMFASELLRYLPTIPYLLMINRIEFKESQINTTVIYLFLIFFIVSFLQLLGFEKAITTYAYTNHIDIAIAGSRMVLTGSDPNVGSIIASFFVMYFLSGFFIRKQFISLLLALISFLLMLTTQGRTTIIGSSVVVIIYVLLAYRTSIFYKLMLILFLLIILYYIKDFFDLSYLSVGVETLIEGENTSINVRLENINYVLDNFSQSPILGWGNSLENSGIVQNVDSEYFLILQRYGVFGLVIIFSLIFNILRYGFIFRKERLGIFSLLMMCSLIFNMSTNVVFYGIQTSSIIIFLLFCLYWQSRIESKYN